MDICTTLNKYDKKKKVIKSKTKIFQLIQCILSRMLCDG